MPAGTRQGKGSGGYSHSAGFVRVPRKAWRRRKKSLGVRIFLLAALGLLIAGFTARRLLSVGRPHYPTHRSGGYPGNSAASSDSPDTLAQTHANPAAQNSGGITAPTQARPDQAMERHGGTGETLTPQDHRSLDQIIHERSK
jgi:hypothetical protein